MKPDQNAGPSGETSGVCGARVERAVLTFRPWREDITYYRCDVPAGTNCGARFCVNDFAPAVSS